jgi:hypothetical protein
MSALPCHSAKVLSLDFSPIVPIVLFGNKKDC